MKELEDCLREALEESPYGIVTNDTALETARKYASELLKQRDELLRALKQIHRYWSRDTSPDYMEDALWTMLDIAEAAINRAEQVITKAEER